MTPPRESRFSGTPARIWFAIAVLLCAVPASGEEEEQGKVTVSGEVVESSCYIRTGARGADHAMCARRCADAGIPLVLLEDETERVIWLASADHRSSPNEALREHIARRVTLTGHYAERGGARLLVIETIAPAPRR